MERALVIGASGGIGAALVRALEVRGEQVTGLSRSTHGLDLTDERSIVAHLSALHPPFHTILVATGALQIDGAAPEKTLRALDPAALAAQFALNAIGPALVLKHALRLMPRDQPARFAVLSARVGSIGDNRLGGWYSYRAAKSALNQLMHTACDRGGAHPSAGRRRLPAPRHGRHPLHRRLRGHPPHRPARHGGAEPAGGPGRPDPRPDRRLLRLAGGAGPVVDRLILVLGDQLTPGVAALRQADKARDLIVMAEVGTEATYADHHPQKIALIFTAMRKFAAHLRAAGWTVAYTRLDDPDNTQSIPGELLRHAAAHGTARVLATRPGEWRLIRALEETPLDITLLPDDRFLSTDAEFATWAEGRKQLRMEFFYREMRRKTGLLMEGDKPAGGQWNFDHDNRKPAKPDLFRTPPPDFPADEITEEVLSLVAARFPDNFGTLRPFRWATDRAGALRALDHFMTHHLPGFGDTQDAMLAGDPTLSHSLLSPYLNLGLLLPREVCDRAQAEWRAGRVPINSAEGFIRQILGWREFMRGIYFLDGPDYPRRNALGHSRALPPLYWGAETRMNCLSHAVAQTRDLAYAHHIQRLMVTGNFALLAGVDPFAVHEWYLGVYIDAYEWVEAPNTVGMSQFADGGMVGSKPYVSSGAYIDRMSDYCGTCAYSVKRKTGQGACPFNLLYWHFLMRHRDRFQPNPRMAQMYRTWDRMAEPHRTAVLADAEAFLAKLDAGERV
jgi:deoxyribodipyrimidine photolyase-related protein